VLVAGMVGVVAMVGRTVGGAVLGVGVPPAAAEPGVAFVVAAWLSEGSWLVLKVSGVAVWGGLSLLAHVTVS